MAGTVGSWVLLQSTDCALMADTADLTKESAEAM